MMIIYHITYKVMARNDKTKMPKEDLKVLLAAQKVFNKMGLKSDFEVSYDSGEGAYDFMFDTEDDYLDCLQIGWVNSEKATEEWEGFEGQTIWGASWSLYNEMGTELIEGGVTSDFEVIVSKLKEIIGGESLGDIATVEGLRNYLNTLVKNGKGHYSIVDHKGVKMLQNHTNLFDEYKEFIINARFERFENDR